MWQPIETAPRDGTEILTWNGVLVTSTIWEETPDDEGHTGWCSATHWQCESYGTYNNYFGKESLPTHWMPLPEPPESTEVK